MRVLNQVNERSNSLPECVGDIEITCQYHNATNRFQIVRIDNIPCFFLERALLPGDRFTFKASPQALVKVFTHEYIGACLSALIPCFHLKLSSA